MDYITKIAAQFFGVIGVGIFVIMFHSKNVNKMLKKKFFMDVAWAFHYFLIGGLAAGIMNVVCCFREIVFINNGKKFFRSKLWLILFVMINWVSVYFTWKGMYCVIPPLVSTMACYSFWQKDVTVTRCIAVSNNVLMFIYDTIVLSYMGMIGESLAFFSIISSLILDRKCIREEKERKDVSRTF